VKDSRVASIGSVNDTSADKRLGEIEHIIVLMKENRSFDQMLGYLETDGLDVDGIEQAKERCRQHPNKDSAGREYPPFAWGPDETLPPVPPGHQAKLLDPCHGPGCVAKQLENENSGFVANFEQTRHEKDPDGRDRVVQLDPDFLKVPMGYFTAEHLPVYDHLAKNFCVCDQWHASIPGDTWPNRLFAISGQEAERVGYQRTLWAHLLAALQGLPGVKGLRDAPIYEVRAFTHELEERHWRWYSHDPATLRAADRYYRQIRHLNRDNFAYVDRTKLTLKEDVVEGALHTHDSFLDDAAKGQLGQLSWIDPNFADLSVLHTTSNDDHPPADVKAGQDLVLQIYDAVANSPTWENTLLIIAYDEHGGFYDHLPAPPSPFSPDNSKYRTLGVRVPALVVGPRVKKHVSHQLFEHTSLIATILRRFAAKPDEALMRMPTRVRQAPHLGALLEEQPRTDIDDHGHLQDQMDAWRIEARRMRQAGSEEETPPGDGAGQGVSLHDFQDEFLRFVLAIRDKGLPPGQP
jgi:phospholipase C